MKILFYDTKPYDKDSFEEVLQSFPGITIEYTKSDLDARTATLADGFDAFVSSNGGAETLKILHDRNVHLLLLRCAGFNNVDMDAAKKYNIRVMRVPGYSPEAVAEHAMALALACNRRLYKAYNKVRENDFSLNGLKGFNFYQKTAGIIGTGKIGRTFIDLCKGLGMKVIAYDPYPAEGSGIEYVPLDTLFRESDVISLHCPLTESSYHIIDREALGKMKDGVFIVNTSRGGIVNEHDLYIALTTGQIRAAASDVFVHEPPACDDPLIHLDNFIATFHIGGSTYESLERVSNRAVDYVFEYTGVPEQKEVIGS